ncbi:MAG: hypothetical protein KKH40_08665, partial [Nanoarchaeota archaeon]|nr:hypothetical protein [Nanoarchaeota archaeon]
MEEEKRGAEADSKLFLKNKFLQKIDYLLVKRMIHNEEVYYLFKDFLREYANVSYEFTHQEIISELKN